MTNNTRIIWLPFKFTLFILFSMLSLAFILWIFVKYKINFSVIFELDSSTRIWDFQIYKLFAVSSFFFLICFTSEFIIFKFSTVKSVFLIELFPFLNIFYFLIMPILPFNVLFKRERMQILFDMLQILTAPFGIVRFWHFFIADLFCSLTKPLMYISELGCFLFYGLF